MAMFNFREQYGSVVKKNPLPEIKTPVNEIVRDNIPHNEPKVIKEKKIDPAQAFMDQYTKSPKYIQRLEKSGYKNPVQEAAIRNNNVKTVKTYNQDGKPGLFQQMVNKYNNVPYSNIGSTYHPKQHAIVMDNKSDKNYQRADDSDHMDYSTVGYQMTKAHELGHAEISNGSQMAETNRLNDRDNVELFNRNKAYQDFDEDFSIQDRDKIRAKGYRWLGHDIKPEENHSDIQSFRFLLKQQGIYDAGQEDFTKEHLKKAKESFFKKRLLNNYKEEDLIWLMNNIAGLKSKYNYQNIT